MKILKKNIRRSTILKLMMMRVIVRDLKSFLRVMELEMTKVLPREPTSMQRSSIMVYRSST